jgi:UDP-N-acetylmuramyl pentapeptide phosphotransferase/UDP-N-acetylglucosamine-1-phosphate transferase
VVGAAAWWAFWTVSAINVVNFIDGIDGLVGAQLVVFGGYVALAAPPASAARALGIAAAAASAGFLVWNWSPAKIFLGDVGSGAYGVVAVLAGVALLAATRMSLLQAFLPLAAVFLDATVTLVRRAREGARLTVAHRSHLYQRLANGPWSHAMTATVYAAAAVGGAFVGLAANSEWVNAAGAAYVVGLAVVGSMLEHQYAPWPRASTGS